MTSKLSHEKRIMLLPAPTLLASVLCIAAWGTLEVRVEPATAPPDATTSTVDAVENAPPTPAPRPPTPVPDDYVGPTPEPAFTPVPVDTYAVPEGLRVVFAKDGAIGLRTAETRTALLTSVGDDLSQVKLADDGQVVAFRRGNELWAIHSDGTNERELLGAEDLDAMESEGIEAQPHHFTWVPGTHTLAFNTRLRLEASDVPAVDLRLADADTAHAEHPLEQTMLHPPGEGGEFTYSPDDSQIAVVTPGDVSLLDADGTNRRHGVLTFAPVTTVSGSDYHVRPVWAADGSALMVAVPPPDPDVRPLQHTTIWRIPTDGSSAELVTTINALPGDYAVSFSPLLTYVAYGELL
jgi:hypothetical protein